MPCRDIINVVKGTLYHGIKDREGSSMAVCPKCGTTNNDGSKFCYNCGGAIPAAPQAPEGFQPIPKPADDGFVPITPTNPLPGYTPIQPVYAQPITQPVQKQINKPKSNGFCNAGLAFSIIGLCTLGSTSLLGLIFSVIGFFSSKKKNQPGTGKAITGMIMSGLIVIGLGFTFAICYNDLKEEFESGAITNPVEFFYALDHANDRASSEYKEKIKRVTEQHWVNTIDGDNTYLEFGNDYTYKMSPSYEELKDNYSAGKFKLYIGEDAMDQIERRYRDSLRKSDVNKLITKNNNYKRDNFIILTLENNGRWENGKNVSTEKTRIIYYGFCYKTISGTYKMDIYNMAGGTHYEFDTLEYVRANRQNNG